MCVAGWGAAKSPKKRTPNKTLYAVWHPADEIDASGILLSQCRSELAETLDDLSAPPIQERWRPFGWLRSWMAMRPAWSGALLVVFGIMVGTQLVPWIQNKNRGYANGPAIHVVAKQPLTPDQLSGMTFSGISFSPSSGSGS